MKNFKLYLWATWDGQVFNEGQLIFFVASRGHHAEIGGITPGRYRPNAKCLEMLDSQ
jgi:hypothetical protein